MFPKRSHLCFCACQLLYGQGMQANQLTNLVAHKTVGWPTTEHNFVDWYYWMVSNKTFRHPHCMEAKLWVTCNRVVPFPSAKLQKLLNNVEESKELLSQGLWLHLAPSIIGTTDLWVLWAIVLPLFSFGQHPSQTVQWMEIVELRDLQLHSELRLSQELRTVRCGYIVLEGSDL